MKIILALALFASASATLYTAEPKSQKYLWESFKKEHHKEYSTMEEETKRFQTFVENLKLIDERNKAEKNTAVHGITKFVDLSEGEFRKAYLNYKPDANKNRTKAEHIKPLEEGASVKQDWTGIYTTPVKDQGYCGSCWAFSATEQIESDYMREHGEEEILSAQQVTSCTKYIFGGGCNGGYTENAFEYAEGGLELDSDYPYTSGKGKFFFHHLLVWL